MAEVETPTRTKRVCDVCDALSDSKSIKLFLDGVSQVGLSRKQYYERLLKLKKTGLVRKYHGQYEVTSTGLVVKRALALIEKAVQIKMNTALRGYDTLRVDNPTVPPEQWIDIIIDDPELREILLDGKRVRAAAVAPMLEMEVEVEEPQEFSFNGRDPCDLG